MRGAWKMGTFGSCNWLKQLNDMMARAIGQR
jgi:hypothetical protein